MLSAPSEDDVPGLPQQISFPHRPTPPPTTAHTSAPTSRGRAEPSTHPGCSASGPASALPRAPCTVCSQCALHSPRTGRGWSPARPSSLRGRGVGTHSGFSKDAWEKLHDAWAQTLGLYTQLLGVHRNSKEIQVPMHLLHSPPRPGRSPLLGGQVWQEGWETPQQYLEDRSQASTLSVLAEGSLEHLPHGS